VIYEPEEGPAQIICSGSMEIAAYSVEDGEKLWWMGGAAWQTKSLPLIHKDLCIVNAFMVSTSEFGGPRVTQSWEEALLERDANGDELISRDEWPGEALHQAWFIFDLDGDDMLNETDYDYLKNAGTATGGLFAIRLGGKGDVTKTHLAWNYSERRGLSDVVSPVVVNDTLFVLRDGGLLTSIDIETGEVIRQKRVGDPDQYYASPVSAGGRLLTASQAGQLAVVSGEGEWEVLSTTDLDEVVWSTPALAEGLIFVRSQTAMYCFYGE
jgi:outer membrane protein assembly factor BamB